MPGLDIDALKISEYERCPGEVRRYPHPHERTDMNKQRYSRDQEREKGHLPESGKDSKAYFIGKGCLRIAEHEANSR